jgi:membrane protein DedA with SNARE-associated domain
MEDALQIFTEWYSAYGYWVLFFGVMLENAGIPLPGETALLAAGYLCHEDSGGTLVMWKVMTVAFVGAVIGDNIGYWLGREVARPRLTGGKRFLFLTPERMAKAEYYFHKYGTFTVFIARFVAILRIVAGPAAGVSGMAWPRFFVANMAGAIVWSVVITLVGFFFGHAWTALHHWLGRGAWVVLGVIVLAVIATNVAAWMRRRSRPEKMTS